MRYLVIAVLMGVAGCDLLTPQYDYLNRRPLDPEPLGYAKQYELVEECLGATGDFDAIRWFVADSIWRDGDPIRAIIRPEPHDITIRADNIGGYATVRHEMVHHVMGAGNSLHDERGNVPCERD